MDGTAGQERKFYIGVNYTEERKNPRVWDEILWACEGVQASLWDEIIETCREAIKTTK